MAERDSKPYGVIYCIEHRETGKKYVGQTTQGITARWRSHQFGKQYCVLLCRAINKYGSESFDVYELAQAGSKYELNEKEIFYISLYETTNRQKGYNLRSGGSFGKHSEESKEKMSRSVRKAYENPAFKQKLIAANTGKKRSSDFCNRTSERMLGTTVTQEAKRKISASVTEYWKSDEYRNLVSEGQKSTRSTAEYKEMVSKNTKAQWSDKDNKERLVAAMSAGKLAMWSDPVKKAAILAKRAATKAAKQVAMIS